MTNKHPLESVAEMLSLALSVCQTVNRSKYHTIYVEGEECVWQTKEWADWAIDEVAPDARKALTTLREYMAETQAVSEITENVLQEIDLNDLFFDLLALDENEITQKYGKLYTKKGKQNTNE